MQTFAGVCIENSFRKNKLKYTSSVAYDDDDDLSSFDTPHRGYESIM